MQWRQTGTTISFRTGLDLSVRMYLFTFKTTAAERLMVLTA